MLSTNIQPSPSPTKQLNFLSDKKVYNKQVIDELADDINETIDNTTEELVQLIQQATDTLYTFKGDCVYVGGGIDYNNPPIEVTIAGRTRHVQTGDLCRCSNNRIIQYVDSLTGWVNLPAIRAGWTYKLTEGIISDASFIGRANEYVAPGSTIAVIQAAEPVQGCEWCWCILSNPEQISYNSLTNLPTYVLPGAQDGQVFRDDVSDLLARPMSSDDINNLWNGA